MQAYSNPERESIDTALPDIEVFELTAEEVAAMDEDLIYEYMERPAFSLATMNSRDRDAMLSAMVEEEGITGGWYYWYCFPGCLPDSEPMGPYATAKEAKEAAQEDAAE